MGASPAGAAAGAVIKATGAPRPLWRWYDSCAPKASWFDVKSAVCIRAAACAVEPKTLHVVARCGALPAQSARSGVTQYITAQGGAFSKSRPLFAPGRRGRGGLAGPLMAGVQKAWCPCVAAVSTVALWTHSRTLAPSPALASPARRVLSCPGLAWPGGQPRGGHGPGVWPSVCPARAGSYA